jgi:predicted ester cyclase
MQNWTVGFALLIDGDSVAQVLSIEGTDDGQFLGLPPTGKPFRVPAVFLYSLRDGQIARERRIYDFTGLLIQVGLLKAKPAV